MNRIEQGHSFITSKYTYKQQLKLVRSLLYRSVNVIGMNSNIHNIVRKCRID